MLTGLPALHQCGGWQTEGWEGIGIDDNIAGFLGYLDFTIKQKMVSLKRSGLNVDADDDDNLVIRLRSSGDVRIQPKANRNVLSVWVNLIASENYKDVRIPIGSSLAWKGAIRSLQLDIHGSEGDFIEVESIQVTR